MPEYTRFPDRSGLSVREMAILSAEEFVGLSFCLIFGLSCILVLVHIVFYCVCVDIDGPVQALVINDLRVIE